MTPQQVDEEVKKAGCSVETYFKRAMRWKYGVEHDTYLDVLKYQVHYIVAPYVVAYTNHLYHQARQEASEDFADDILPVLIGRGDV